MKNWGRTTLIAVTLLTCSMLTLVTIGAIIGGSTTSEDLPTEQEMEEIIEDVLNEVSTYLQIKDKIGKYYGEPHQQKIEKIAIMISPLVSQNINLSQLTIKINNGEQIKVLSYQGSAQKIGSNGLFEHPIWNEISENTFGLVITHDTDNSIEEYDTLNSNTDMTYIIIKLDGSFKMKKGNSMIVTLFPETGIQKTVFLEVLDLPIKSVVSL